MIVAFFDFDGTITKDDSLIKFIRFIVGDFKTLIGVLFLSPILVAYKLKLISNNKAKRMLLAYFLKGMDVENFHKLAGEYSLKYIDTMLRAKAMERIRWHKEQGHEVVVVSASIECWLKPWCDQNGLGVIATKMEIVDGLLTGELKSKNCYGLEKVVRINAGYKLDEYEYVYAYGDSRGDKEMFEMANESFYKPFR